MYTTSSPGGNYSILKSYDSVTVTIIAAMDAIYVNSYEHDSIFEIGDWKTSLASFLMITIIWGVLHRVIMQNVSLILLLAYYQLESLDVTVIAWSYSSKITMHIKPAKKWGAARLSTVKT